MSGNKMTLNILLEKKIEKYIYIYIYINCQ